MGAVLFSLRVAVVVLAWIVITLAFAVVSLPLWGSRWLASGYARTMSWAAMRLIGVRLDVRHLERVRQSRPCIFVANHQSNLDYLFLGAVYPTRTVVIGKRSVALVPFFGLLYLATRNILIDRRVRAKAIAGLDLAVRAMKTRGESIWIFPEGTRNRTGDRLGPLKKGAFHMALEAQVPLVPIVLSPIGGYVDFRAKRMRGGTARIDVLEPIPTAGLTIADLDALRERTREAMWRGLEAMEKKDAAPLPEAIAPPGAEPLLPRRDEARAT